MSGAAVLRFGTLGRWPLWIDEAFTLHDAHDVSPAYPLAYVSARVSTALVGDGEFALRLAPALSGVATVAVLATWGHDNAARARARLAALLLALSSWHLFWSQSSRAYAPLVLLVVVAARLLSTHGAQPAQRVAGATFALAAAVLYHPTAAFFLPAAAALAYARSPRRAAHARSTAWIALSAAAVFTAAALKYGHLVSVHLRFKGQGSPVQFVTSYGFQAGPLLLAVAALGALNVLRVNTDWRARVTPGTTFGAATGLLFVATSFVLFTTGYHAIGTLPFVMLLAARGALWGSRARRRALVALLVLEQTVGLGLYHASGGMRPRYREAAELVRGNPAAAVYATREAPLAYYLAEDRTLLRDPPSVRPIQERWLDDLEHAVGAHASTWVVVHPDDIAGWSASSRMRIDRLLGGVDPVVFANQFGPKELTLRAYRVPRVAAEVER